jgi:hypothetical protein
MSEQPKTATKYMEQWSFRSGLSGSAASVLLLVSAHFPTLPSDFNIALGEASAFCFGGGFFGLLLASILWIINMMCKKS